MGATNRLGANIRSLRMAHGETQEQLGEAIGGFAKNAISYYETGRREPNKETLRKIAKHYVVSVEDLLYSDMTSIGEITINMEAFWENIDVILPIVSSDRAMKNESFKKAFEAHKEFYDWLHQASLDKIDNVDVCIEGYMIAIEDDDIEAEAAANFIALWYLLMIPMKAVPLVMGGRPAALGQIIARNAKAKRIIENASPSFEADTKAILTENNDNEMKKMMSEMLTAVKRSKKWSDLADYYLALQYVCNLVDNNLDWGFNLRIGAEMMDAFASVKNKYAAQFLKYSSASFRVTKPPRLFHKIPKNWKHNKGR